MIDQELRECLRALLSDAASKIDRVRYEQEPNYTAAFFGKLDGEKVTNKSGLYIKFEFSVSNDRGMKSAEHETGIDIGMVFEWNNDESKTFKKAVLMQAKNKVASLSPSQRSILEQQCSKMASYSKSCVVMDCPFDNSVPSIYEVVGDKKAWQSSPIPLSTYISDYILECMRGDINSEIINLASRSDRALKVITNMPKPKSTPKRAPRGPGL